MNIHFGNYLPLGALSVKLNSDMPSSGHKFVNILKTSLDMEVNALQERVTEQEEFNSKGSKRSVQRLQDDIRELEKRKENDDTSKNVKKLERKYKEAVIVLEEDRKFLNSMLSGENNFSILKTLNHFKLSCSCENKRSF